MLFIEICAKVVTRNTLEKLTELLLQEMINTEQNLISQCINTLKTVLNLQNNENFLHFLIQMLLILL